MTTPILNLKEIPDGMEKPQLTVNQDLRDLESACNHNYELDFTSGDIEITDEADADPDLNFVFSRYFIFVAVNNAVARTLTLIPKIRSFVIDNKGSATLNIQMGSTAVSLESNYAAFVYSDGSADGLRLISKVSLTPSTATGSPVTTVSGTSYNVDSVDNCGYKRFTSTSAKTVLVRANSTHALPADYELNIRNAAASNLTISPAGGVTVTAPYLGTLVVPPNGTVTLKRVTTDVFDLIGATVPL